MNEPLEYIQHKGIKHKSVGKGGKEIRFPCPVCKEDEGFQYNTETGFWCCLRGTCGAKGNLHQLKVAFGDAYDVDRPKEIDEYEDDEFAKQLASSYRSSDDPIEQYRLSLVNSPDASEARKYLASRGISSKIWMVASLGWLQDNTQVKTRASNMIRPDLRSKNTNNGWITIPYVDTGMVKLRAVPPEQLDHKGKPMRYKRIPGKPTSIYAPLGLSEAESGKPLLLCGGEIDCLSVLQSAMDQGIKDFPFSVAAPASESSWSTISDLVDSLKGDVIIAFDNDDAGRQASDKASIAFGRWRCKTAKWPNGHKDANDCLVSGDLKWSAILEMISNAVSSAGDQVGETPRYKDRVKSHIRRSGAGGWKTSFPTLNMLFGGGMKPGETTVVSGHTATGKSVITSQIVLDFYKQNLRTFFCPFELGVDRQLERTLWQLCGKDPRLLSDEEIDDYMDRMGDLIMWFDHYGAISADAYIETLTYVVRRLDVSLVVIDHRDFMIKRGRRDRWDNSDDLVLRIVKTIQQSPAHCLLVVHPAKNNSSGRKERDEWLPQLSDLKGHSDIYQDVDNCMSMWRQRSNDRTDLPGDDGYYDAGLVVLKMRDLRGKEGLVELKFDKDKATYFEASMF